MNNQDACGDEVRSRAVAHEAGHAVTAALMERVTLKFVYVDMGTCLGHTRCVTPDDADGRWTSMLIFSAGMAAEQVVTGGVDPLVTSTNDLMKMAHMAELMTEHHRDYCARLMVGRNLPNLAYVEELFPGLTSLQQSLIAAAIGEMMWRLPAHRTALDVVSGLLSSESRLSGDRVIHALAAIGAEPIRLDG